MEQFTGKALNRAIRAYRRAACMGFDLGYNIARVLNNAIIFGFHNRDNRPFHMLQDHIFHNLFIDRQFGKIDTFPAQIAARLASEEGRL